MSQAPSPIHGIIVVQSPCLQPDPTSTHQDKGASETISSYSSPKTMDISTPAETSQDLQVVKQVSPLSSTFAQHPHAQPPPTPDQTITAQASHIAHLTTAVHLTTTTLSRIRSERDILRQRLVDEAHRHQQHSAGLAAWYGTSVRQMGEAFAGEMVRVKARGEEIQERLRVRVGEVERMLGIEVEKSGRAVQACEVLTRGLQAARLREEGLLNEKEVLQLERQKYEAENKRLEERWHSKELVKSLEEMSSSNTSLKTQLARSERALVIWKSTVETTIAEQFAAERKQVAEMKAVDDALARREIEELERKLKEEMARNEKLVDAEHGLKRALEAGDELAITRDASDRARSDAKAELTSIDVALEMIAPEVMIQDTPIVEGTPEAVQEDGKQDLPGYEDWQQHMSSAHQRTKGRAGSMIFKERGALAAKIADALHNPPGMGCTEMEMTTYNQWVNRTLNLNAKIRNINNRIAEKVLKGPQHPEPLALLAIHAKQSRLLKRAENIQTHCDPIRNPAIHTVPEEKNTALKVAQDDVQKLQHDLDLALANNLQLQTCLAAETEAKQRFEISAQLANVAKELAEEAAEEAGTQAALARVVVDAMKGERDAAREATEEARTREVDDPYHKRELEGRLESVQLGPAPLQSSQELELARTEIASLRKALDTERTNFDNFHRKFAPFSHRRLTSRNESLRQNSGERESRRERDERGGWTPYAREGDRRPEWRRRDAYSPGWDGEYQRGGTGRNGRR